MRVAFALALGMMLATAASASCSDQIQTCYSCTGASSGDCGWNAGTQTCERGTSSGPSGSLSTPVGWFWTQTSCCSNYNTCYDCTTAPQTATGAQCGWNTASGTCEYGSSTGPHSTSNDDGFWAWTSDQCSASGSSSSGSNQFCDWNYDCSDCIDTAGCGWDNVGDMCMSGNSLGPYNGFTTDWKYYNCNTAWTWRFSYDSASMWLTWFFIVCFFSCCGACMRRRRRVVVVGAASGPTNGASLVNNAQNVQYGTQPPPPAYGTVVPNQQQDLYGPSKYENTQAEGV